MTPPALQPATLAKQHRFHLLDALRGVAAILVVEWHVQNYLHAAGKLSSYLAVDFFFCLSGFVIAFSYEKRLEGSLAFKDFLAARVIRLYPTYFLGVLLGIGAACLLEPQFPLAGAHAARFCLLIVVQLLMLPNLGLWPTPISFPLDFPAWSLFFEMIANLAFAVLVRRGMIKRAFLVAGAAILGLLWILQAMRGGSLDAGFTGNMTGLSKGLVRVGLSFLLGVGIFHLYRRTTHPSLSAAWHGVLAAAITLLLILILQSPWALLRSTGFHLLAVLVLFPALVYCGALVRTPSSWTHICIFLGNLSYPLYLLHAPIVDSLEVGGVGRWASAHRVILPLLLMVLAAVVAHLAVTLYDIPVRIQLNRRYNAALTSRPTAARPT